MEWGVPLEEARTLINEARLAEQERVGGGRGISNPRRGGPGWA